MLEIAEAINTSFSWDLFLFWKKIDMWLTRVAFHTADTSKSLIFNFKSLFLLIYRLFQSKFIANEATELRSEVASAAEL